MQVVTRRDRHLLLGLAALALMLGAVTLVGVHGDVLLAAPALLFALPLLAGRYVGEERLTRLASARLPVLCRAAAALPATARRSPRVLPRGGRLIAASLAVRPPPAHAAA
ncbi:MAG: hypothetical protein QOJ35_24 [Solirubrobacteraceae bacterium]|jgi:hypothetical protein|nr:hypothetical protein [Solirubrobacteraceae bacterium]